MSKEGTKSPEPGFCVEVTVMMTAAKKMRNLLPGTDLKGAEASCRSMTRLLGNVSHAMVLWRTGSWCTGVKV